MIIVAVIVYNRYSNITRWISSWKQCEQHGAQLIIIHNYDGNEKIKELCDRSGIKYIRRANKGFDIGAFQEVCKERLPGFPNNWDKLLWCCDDTYPMSKDFLAPFLNDSGIVCTDLSPHVKTHIRTTGFIIDKGTSKRVIFEKDPITTKEDCYHFEHRSPKSFYEQMEHFKIPVKQVAPRENSPLWDSGYKRRLDRGKELEDIFPSKTLVTFICPIYNGYPQIISSLITQTHKNWRLLLIHDGPASVKYNIEDERITYIETKERIGNWGHGLRAWALDNMDELSPGTDYVVITNNDNYHVPVYTEYMLRELENNPEKVASYCSEMVHSYKAWQVIPCSLQLGFIDCAGVMVKKEVACEIGWKDITSHSSDFTYFSGIIKKYGPEKWERVTGCLIVHN